MYIFFILRLFLTKPVIKNSEGGITMYDNLPNDPVMLLSFVNTKLRDHYTSFEDFTQALQVDGSQIVAKLKSIDYEYDSVTNQFI
jgi:hypothetical protein